MEHKRALSSKDTGSKSKRVCLSKGLPKSLFKEQLENSDSILDTEPSNIDEFKDYLSRVTLTQPGVGLDTIVETQIKYKPLQLVNMVQLNDKFEKADNGKIAFLPLAKHIKSWTVKQLPAELQRFSLYSGLHQLWLQYMKNWIDSIIPHGNISENTSILSSKLVRADYHGALITIKESKCNSMVGLTGIVLHESAHMFSVVCTDNKARCIPKKDSIFSISCHGITFILYGKHLIINPTERSTKKFKPRNTIELISNK
jgi:RNase P/RNase MRP subunit p29